MWNFCGGATGEWNATGGGDGYGLPLCPRNEGMSGRHMDGASRTGGLVESGAATDGDQHGTLFRQVAIVVVPFVEDGGLARFVPPGSRPTALTSWDVWR